MTNRQVILREIVVAELNDRPTLLPSPMIPSDEVVIKNQMASGRSPIIRRPFKFKITGSVE